MGARKLKSGADLTGQRGINFGDPTNPTDATNKQYVDNLVAGLASKKTVRLKTVGNVNLASALAAGQTVDGKTVAQGDRIFVGSQTTASENGIYVAPASGAASRATDMDTGSEALGAFIIVSEGTANDNTMWLETTDGPLTIGTTALAFTQVQMGVTYTADGNGIELSGTQFYIELDGSSLSKSSSGLKLGSAAGGAGLTVSVAGVIDIGAGTGIVVNPDTIQVDTNVVATKYSASCVATTNPQTFNHGKGQYPSIQVWEGTEQIDCGITNSTTGGGTCTVDFGSNPTVGQYVVVVIG